MEPVVKPAMKNVAEQDTSVDEEADKTYSFQDKIQKLRTSLKKRKLQFITWI